VYIKWNDACEGDSFDDVHMSECVQETAGFYVDKDIDDNWYIARDWNTLEEGEWVKVIRIPEKYIIEKKFFEL
jgi:hypothetical protein